MFTLRATQKLLRRAKVPVEEPETPSTTTLGDWYADLLVLRPQQLVLCVSERTLLPVIVPAAEISTLPDRLRAALQELLLAIGVPQEMVETEIAEMQEVRFARTANRKVVGHMNYTAGIVEATFERHETQLDRSLYLADLIAGPLNMQRPRVATLALFERASPVR